MEYKIQEKMGTFLVLRKVLRKNWIFGKSYESFEPCWIDYMQPADFNTLEEARQFIKLIQKPVVFHSLQ